MKVINRNYEIISVKSAIVGEWYDDNGQTYDVVFDNSKEFIGVKVNDNQNQKTIDYILGNEFSDTNIDEYSIQYKIGEV